MTKTQLRRRLAVFAAGCVAICFMPSAQAVPSLPALVVHQFSGWDGASPNGGLLRAPSGVLYGSAYSGGAKGGGVLFSLSASGSQTVLHSFGASGDGANPCGQLAIGQDGALYGTTLKGGAHGAGTIYRVSQDGSYALLHSFGASDDGSMPYGGVTFGSSGDLYGVTFAGGSGKKGAVFSCSTAGVETVVHSFDALDSHGSNSDGALSYAALVQGPDDALYGTTAFGGHNGAGTVFKLDSGRDFSVVHSFAAKSKYEGANPYAGLVKAGDGNLYGTTYSGGAGGTGTIFRVDDSGGFLTLYSFSSFTSNGTNRDGANPSAALVEAAGSRLIGVAGFGGANGSGSLFSVDTSGNFAALYQFPQLQSDMSASGPARPYGAVAALPNGSLVAAGYYGGKAASGAIVCVMPPAAPVITGISPDGIAIGQPTTLTVSGTNFLPGAVAQWNGQDVPTTVLSDSKLIATVPAPGATALGTANIGVYNPVGISGNAASVALLQHIFSPGLQLISVPYDYSGNSLDSILNRRNQRLADWMPVESRYAVTPTSPADTLHQGNAYWARFRETIGLKAISSRSNSRQAMFTMRLGAGWNMVGDPFSASVPVSTIIVVDSRKQSHSWSDAVARGLIKPALYSYDPSVGGYTVKSGGSIDPYAGYWLKTGQAVTLRVPAPR